MAKISRREFSKTVAKGLGATVLAGSSLLSFPEKGQAKTPKHPNFVFISSDQHSYKYIGYMDHPFVKSPNLDKIARQGVAFTNNYCGNPVCVPGRSSMMTGMYASDVNSFCNATVWDGSHPTWVKRLKDAGYYTWGTGKMDLNDKYDIGLIAGEVKNGHAHKPDITALFRRPVAYRVGERENVKGEPRDERNSDNEDAEKALHFISNESKEKNQPWAIYVGFHEPHPKFRALKAYWDMYYPNRVDMPNIPPGYLEDLHLVYQELRHFKRIATPIPDDRIRRARAAYYGMITELDEYIGQLWDALEKTDQLKNTIFIYTSDHGESLGEHGLWYKNNLFDVGCRVPLLISGPGIPKNVKIDTPMGHVDLAATILEWAGIDRGPELRGYSLLPMMNGKAGNHPGIAFCETHSEGNATGSFMIRKGDWKYIHFTWYRDLLFNVKDDPYEFENRIDDPETKEIQAQLKQILHSRLDPEEVTIRAFKKQEKMLADLSETKSEKELEEIFLGRLGKGQTKAIINKLKG